MGTRKGLFLVQNFINLTFNEEKGFDFLTKLKMNFFQIQKFFLIFKIKIYFMIMFPMSRVKLYNPLVRLLPQA